MKKNYNCETFLNFYDIICVFVCVCVFLCVFAFICYINLFLVQRKTVSLLSNSRWRLSLNGERAE